MEIRLATSGLQALVTELRLRASVTTDSVEAQATAVLLDAAVEYLLLKADATVGEFVKLLVFFELVAASDAAALTVSKQFSDTQSTADQLVSVLAKALIDAVGTAEVLLFTTAKPLIDAALITDAPAKTFVRAPADELLTTSDVPVVVPQKGLVDVAYSLEGPAFGQTYADPTYFAQDYAWDGSPAKLIGKNLSELLDSTDDFFGVANPDDDQTIFFTKSLISHAATGEVFSRAFTTSRSDGFSATDIVLLTTSRPLASSAANVDITVKLAGKNVADSTSSADAGSLRMTDYADISYFAQDYVGTSLSF